MVNIVIVSHSEQLAAGVRELARQMTQGNVKIAVAGGIDDPEQPIGTDAIKVLEAIQSVYSEDGVLVLMDLGSALLSAETALEFLEPEQAQHVRLCPAPLVEGALAAAVQASVGANIDAVFVEAMGALRSKQQQMPELLPPQPVQEETATTTGQELRLTVSNRLGLHARPAARFVTTANRFQATIEVRKGQQRANAKSINQVATLGARQGDEIVVSAAGPDASAALAAMQALADDNFGDRDDELQQPPQPSLPQPAAQPAGDKLSGIGASPGIAIGPLRHYAPRLPEVEIEPAQNSEQEWQELENAIDASIAELENLHNAMSTGPASAEAEIFDAHVLILRDPDLRDRVRTQIYGRAIAAPGAWQESIGELAREYEAIQDEYMRARAADVRDVGARVLSHLIDFEAPTLDLSSPSIIAARDLTPSDTARFDPAVVLAVCTELGGATSHSAILARALGIPAIVGIGPAVHELAEGQIVAVDGDAGILWLQPEEEALATLKERRRQLREEREQLQKHALEPAITTAGHRIEVAANIGGPQDVTLALEQGAEGIGLFRTEFLFLERAQAPTEDEQFAAYRQVAVAMDQRPVIIRTLDVGGDKPISYLDLAAEENPFLGWRGIRFCLDNPQVFLPQLRAILRAGHGYNVKIMFPMIGAVSELLAARALLRQAQDELKREGQQFDEAMEVGIMIEVPSAVSIADQLAPEVDFFSIGTNDLTQYVMAADRGNRRVANLADALQPAVLREIARTIKAGHDAGIWVGMCGELAGVPLATPLLVGLGLDELSMNAPAIPQVKAHIRATSQQDTRHLVEQVLSLPDAQQVRAALQRTTATLAN